MKPVSHFSNFMYYICHGSVYIRYVITFDDHTSVGANDINKFFYNRNNTKSLFFFALEQICAYKLK